MFFIANLVLSQCVNAASDSTNTWKKQFSIHKFNVLNHNINGTFTYPSIRYSHFLSVPLEEIKYARDQSPLRNKPSLGITFGLTRQVYSNTLFSIGARVMNIKMGLDPSAVKISNEYGQAYEGWRLTSGNFSLVYTNVYFRLLRNINLPKGKLKQRVGLGLSLNTIFRSKYQIHAEEFAWDPTFQTKSGSFEAFDIREKDNFFSMFPEFQYQIRLKQLKQGSLWFDVTYLTKLRYATKAELKTIDAFNHQITSLGLGLLFEMN